jgi:hypothetical protein
MFSVAFLTWTVKVKNKHISIGLSSCRTIALSDQRVVGLMGCRIIATLPIEFHFKPTISSKHHFPTQDQHSNRYTRNRSHSFLANALCSLVETLYYMGSVAIIRHPISPTTRWSDSAIVRQLDSPIEMCLFFTFTVFKWMKKYRHTSTNANKYSRKLVKLKL